MCRQSLKRCKLLKKKKIITWMTSKVQMNGKLVKNYSFISIQKMLNSFKSSTLNVQVFQIDYSFWIILIKQTVMKCKLSWMDWFECSKIIITANICVRNWDEFILKWRRYQLAIWNYIWCNYSKFEFMQIGWKKTMNFIEK